MSLTGRAIAINGALDDLGVMPATESEQRERVPVHVFASADAACEETAREIAELIRSRLEGDRPVVLGLATGSTPIRLYQRLIRMHREEGLSFRRVITFNLDEYYGLGPGHPQSYHHFMRSQLFDHIDVPAENIHIPDGTSPRGEVYRACADYERAIKDCGGIDLQILGIGRSGHIGFNEPGSDAETRTRLVTLEARTRRDAARDFLGEQNVPRYAITMGVGTILEARRIVLLAWGANKSAIIRRAVEEAPSEHLPAGYLQRHGNAVLHIDQAAAAELTRVSHPWLVGPVEWLPTMVRRSAVWLGQKTGKPVLKLVDSDYTENGLGELLTTRGTNAYQVNIEVFNRTQHTITGWPGGKPGADDSHRPERSAPNPKRVLVLAPEPQDDVLCLGGTLNRLVHQGHEVKVAFLASGNLAVPDEEVLRATETMVELATEEMTPNEESGSLQLAAEVRREIESKDSMVEDSVRLRRFKAIIRRSEARMALRLCGVATGQIVFLDLPFYERGRYRQFVPTAEDSTKVSALLDGFQPHQIFLTGAHSDPSSTDAVGFSVICSSLLRDPRPAWVADCFFWVYRGGGEAWPIDQIDMAVPLSPDELDLKLQAIHQHRTQRSQTPLTANSPEAWRQAEENDRQTARLYDKLGLAEYDAIETFKRWMP